jgi:hypothetical protein
VGDGREAPLTVPQEGQAPCVAHVAVAEGEAGHSVRLLGGGGVGGYTARARMCTRLSIKHTKSRAHTMNGGWGVGGWRERREDLHNLSELFNAPTGKQGTTTAP